MTLLTQANVREQFPIVSQQLDNNSLIYFDNAATSQKPWPVINAETKFYQQQNANVHRASHQLSSQATRLFEQSRYSIQQLINAPLKEQIIWTKGATEAINLVAHSWGIATLTAGDEIVLSYAEHHANIVPWQLVAEKTGANIIVLPLTSQGVIDISVLAQVITTRTKIVCCSYISNVLGKINPIEKIISAAKRVGAITLIDGAQAVAHFSVDVQALDCDFFVFSAHKMYGPTGVGVLYGRYALLEMMPPYQAGGEMIEQVSFINSTYREPPFKFEAGTPNIAGIVAFAAAIEFLQNNLTTVLQPLEQTLLHYCYRQLNQIKGLQFIVDDCPDIAIFAFTIDNIHSFDVAAELDSKGIAVRSGHHCAMPLMSYLQISGCVRVSLAPFNTKAEIDKLCQCLQSLVNDNDKLDGTDIAQSVVSTKPSATTIQLDEILRRFPNHLAWDARHREIMLLAKTLNKMSKLQRIEEHLIAGCESVAWLTASLTTQGHFTFQADSDAKIIRGLLVIIIAAYQHKSAKQILAFDIDGYFEHLGLLQHLSPSRGNGVKAIVQRIKSLVSTFTKV